METKFTHQKSNFNSNYRI